jgi:hypothetical protein
METAKMPQYLCKCGIIHNGILFSHKEDEILSFAGKWMELENIISQAQKAKNHVLSLMCRL